MQFQEDAHRKKSARASLQDKFGMGMRESSTGYQSYGGGGYGNDRDQYSHGHQQHSNPSSSSSSSYHRGNQHQSQKNNFDQRAQQYITRQMEHDSIQAQKEKNRLMREARMAKEQGLDKGNSASSSSYQQHNSHSSYPQPHSHSHQGHSHATEEDKRRRVGGAGGGGWSSSHPSSRSDHHYHHSHPSHPSHPDDEWPTFEEETITLPLSYNRNLAQGLGEGASSIVDVKPVKAVFDVDKVSEYPACIALHCIEDIPLL